MSDFEKVYEIKFDTRDAQAALRKLDKSLVGIGKEARKAGDRLRRNIGATGTASMARLNAVTKKTRLSMKKLGTSISAIGKKLSYLSAGVAAFGALSIKSAMDLNKEMANVSTLLSGGVDQTKRLKSSVQDLAISTGKSTTDLAGGLYDVVSALGENVQNAEQLGIAAKASVAGLSATKEAIGLLTATTKGYGDTSVDAMNKVSDLAFQTVKLGVTTFPELSASMGRVIPLAAAMNTSQEELFGTMATLTGVTGNAAEVSTQLASVYSSFLKPSEAMTKVANKYGFETAGAMLKAKGFRQSLILLNDAVDGNEGKLAKMLKRKEALIAALALLGGQSDSYRFKLKQMGNAVGSTDAAYKKQTEGINKQGHEWEKTKQRMIVFSQRLGDKLLPVLDRLLDAIEPIIKALENMTDAQMDSIVQWGLFVVALGPALTILGKLILVAGKVKAAITAIATVAGVSAGVVAGAIAAIAAAVAGTYRYWMTLRNGMELFFGSVVTAFWVAIRGIAGGINELAGLVKKIPVIGNIIGDGNVIDVSGLDARVREGMAHIAGRVGGFGEALEQDYQRVYGDKSPEQKSKESRLASLKAQVNQQKNIAKYGGAAFMPATSSEDNWDIQSQSNLASGGGGGSITNNVSVQVDGGNPAAVTRAVEKGIRNANRQQAKDLRRASKSLVAGEQ